MKPLLRYGVAAVGPIGSAGAQFLLQLLLLKALPADQFGSASFLLVTSQLCFGLWSALFSAPLLVFITHHAKDDGAPFVRAIFATSLALILVTAAGFLGIGAGLGVPPGASAIFAAYVVAALLRWMGRAHAYAIGRPLRAMRSDLLYTAILVAAALAIVLAGRPTLELAYLALFAAAAIGLLPFGTAFFRPQFVDVAPRDLRAYASVWREHSGWSLTGVLTTEATVNCHAYIVTALFGPAAFAAIAATALMIRPINVAANALMEFERAQMARAIGSQRLDDVTGSRRLFRFALTAIWVATVIATIVLLTYWPRKVFPAHYPIAALVIGAALWLIVTAVRTIRIPDSALLQAAGQFRPLALASVYACLFSIAGVLVMLAFAPPIWSLLGLLGGEIAFTGWTWRAARRWMAGARSPAAPAASPILAASIAS